MAEEEERVLQEEFRWLLLHEVNAVLRQLQTVLQECSKWFLLPGSTESCLVKAEKYLLTSATGADHVKAVITLYGDNICTADMSVKIHRHSTQNFRTSFREGLQWKLQAIQNAANHLQAALDHVTSIEQGYLFQTGEEVVKVMDDIMGRLNRGRDCLTTPRKRTLEELYSSKIMKMFSPALPNEVIVSFHIHCHKLVLGAYQVHPLQSSSQKPKTTLPAIYHPTGSVFELGSQKYEVVQSNKVEVAVPWLNDVITYFTVGLQLCQQLKDKITVFQQYWKD
ncbi:protein rogdi homolog [Branchiostoma floridae]|uniref:Protein rogdi homolog n=1 Tax=Branchiostoma floridae TaxID=7739 RepID=A0A9J7M1P4_BRAFL|nr:protein rogdi homolog [Branchiostoma floridae]